MLVTLSNSLHPYLLNAAFYRGQDLWIDSESSDISSQLPILPLSFSFSPHLPMQMISSGNFFPGITTVISRNEANCYLQGWRWLVSWEMKTTVISRIEGDISRNVDYCYTQGWQLLTPGMKTTVISGNEDDCYIQGERPLLSQEMKMTVFFKHKVYSRLLSQEMKMSVFSSARHTAISRNKVDF